MKKLIRTQFPVWLGLFTLLILSPLNVFACACCADEGYYRIGVQKPGTFELGELQRLKFGAARIYSTAGFPDDIKGLDPISENYVISASVNSNGWKLDFRDGNGKTGALTLGMPKSFVHYAVDTRNGKRIGAGSVELYKEWRFKSKVRSGSGIFQKGSTRKSEYFLVLQGRGNVCTSAEQFSSWRLEVTGKRASYAFFGGFKREIQSESVKKAEVKSVDRKIRLQELSVDNLVGNDYSGCGCSGITKQEAAKKGTKKLFFWSEWKPNSEKETLVLNLNGKDTELMLRRKAERPAKESIGDRFSDEYGNEQTRVILDYATKKLPCDGCEGTDYDVTATIIGKYSGKVVSLVGSCGC